MKKYAKEFTVSTAPQRSEQWFEERCGKPSASGLGLLFDTKANGTPSAKAKQYLKQLAYERKFGVTYQIHQTKPMADGVFFEDFAKMVYVRETGSNLEEAFSYISDWFVATPDAIVLEATNKPDPRDKRWQGTILKTEKGLLECKIVGDKTFLEMMENGIPVGHELQTQGQLMASGLDWVDYIVVNLKTRAYFIIRVQRNNKLIKRIYERLHEPLDLPKLDSVVDIKRFDEDALEGWMNNNNIKEQELELPELILPF